MPLAATIATIIDRTKRLEICDTLHDAQNAPTEDDLIKAGLPLVVFAYQAGIVDDALLASDFTEATLNANRVYTTGAFTLNNPHDEIFIMRDANVTVNLATGLVEDSRCKISVMGAANLILVASDTAYATVKAYDNATVDITINDEAMVDFETKDNVSAAVVQNNNSVFQLKTHGESTVNHVGNGTSYGNAKVFQHSQLTSVVNPPATIDVTTYQSGQIFLT